MSLAKRDFFYRIPGIHAGGLAMDDCRQPARRPGGRGAKQDIRLHVATVVNYSVHSGLVPLLPTSPAKFLTELPRQSTFQAEPLDAATKGTDEDGSAGGALEASPTPGGDVLRGSPRLRVAAGDDNATGADQSDAAPAAVSGSGQASAGSSFHRYPFYSPRFWHGMRPLTWYRLLKAGRFRVHPTRIPMAIGVSIASLVNVVLTLLQHLIFRRRLAEAELQGPPVFIVGHWRSGTTLLHELMVRDERLSSPSTFQCFAPHHFLVTEWFFRRFAGWLLPGKRPMDNMAAGWERPQEDEFALLTLGLPSPYQRIAFPNQPPPNLDYLDFQGVADDEIRRWLGSLRRFLSVVSTATGRPLIIKSPTHTGRIAWLAREFPEAKFIHITRDPRELFPSTCRLWRGLDDVQALQKPNDEQIEDYVIDCLRRMYTAFHQQRDKIDPARLIDVRYEDLTDDPVGTLRRIYETLRLSDFDSVQPAIQEWVDEEHRDYKPNQHQLPVDKEALIRDAWQDYFQRYGY